jgi:hypothetical protein
MAFRAIGAEARGLSAIDEPFYECVSRTGNDTCQGHYGWVRSAR